MALHQICSWQLCSTKKKQRTTILTLCPVSPGFPGAPGTPGKPLELTKSKSQLLLAIMIIQYTHTKSAG